jgi:N-acetylmuramoyl-L-alanine amidase
MFCDFFKKEEKSVLDGVDFVRFNKNGMPVLEIPEERYVPVKPEFSKAKKHIYPLNTRYVDDPDKGGVIKPKGLVWHYTVTYHTDSTVKYFRRNVVDIHWVVGHKGEIVQMVPCNRRAAHAGKSKWNGLVGLNKYFLGIEFVNIGPLFPHKGKYLDWYNNSKRKKGTSFSYWTGSVIDNPDLGHRYWEPLTDAQIRVGKEISYWAMQEYGIPIENIISHHECSPGRKIDIGGTVYGGIASIRNELTDWVKS